MFYDQYRSPLSVLEAARIINFLCESEVKGETINFGGPERLSRYDLSLRLCKTAGFDEALLIKTSMNDLPDLSPVEDVSMNVDKLKYLGFKFKSIDEVLIEILY